MKKGITAVIPVRYGQTPLAVDPLVQIAGKPMLQQVYDRVVASEVADRVIVATDSQADVKMCETANIPCELVPTSCRNDVERVAAVLDTYSAGRYLSVACNEPAFSIEALKTLAAASFHHVSHTMTLLTEKARLNGSDYFKVVTDNFKYALCITRSSVPFGKIAKRYHTTGMFQYTKHALQRYSGYAPGDWEVAESNGALRWLENGDTIKMVEVPEGGPVVLTSKDVARVEAYLKDEKDSSSK